MTDYDNLPIDRLRWLQKHADVAEVRNGARRALEARLLEHAPDKPNAYQVSVSASEFGTPRPEIRVSVPSARGRRELYAVLHDVAGGLERALASTREAWNVELRRIDEREGAVYLELMDGHQAEIDRALAVLRRALPDGDADQNPFLKPIKPGPGRKRYQRPAPAPVVDPAQAADVAELMGAERQLPLTAAGDEMPPEAVEHERLGERLTAALSPPFDPTNQLTASEIAAEYEAVREARRSYRRVAGRKADRFETRTLKRDDLPTCARAVLDGHERSAEYWGWLRNEYQAAQTARLNGGK